MKTCDKCELEKGLAEFSKDGSKKDGLQSKCKSCQKEISKQWRFSNPGYNKKKTKQYRLDNPEYNKQYMESKKDGLYHVYILPNHNYAGYTSNLYSRMNEHKCQDRNTSNYEIAGSFKNKADAIWFEALLHSVGYEGKRIYNTRK
jgi:predicted GIY-YIG superfamily endonuclease